MVQLTDWCISGPQWLNNKFSCKSEDKNKCSCNTGGKISHFMCAAWQLLRVLIVYYDNKDFLVFRDNCLSTIVFLLFYIATSTQNTNHQYSHIYWYNYSSMKGIVRAKNDCWRRSFLFCFCESSQRHKHNHRMTLKRKKKTPSLPVRSLRRSESSTCCCPSAGIKYKFSDIDLDLL